MKRSGYICLCMLLCVVMALSTLSGCGANKAGSDAQGTADSNTGNAKDTLVIAMDQDILGLDPFAQNETINNVYTYLIYDSLMKIDPKTGELLPGLADSYKIISPLEYEFKLHPDVKFHDGTPLKASDVKYSIERARNSSGMAPKVQSIKEVQIVDDSTVKVILNTPASNILNMLAFAGTSILSESFCNAHQDKYAHNGTGPYVFKEWVPGESVTLDRNESYWGAKAAMPHLKFLCMPEATTRTIALEAGQVDLVTNLAAVDIEKVKADSNFKVYENVSSQVVYMDLNNKDPRFSNLKARQAIAHAINKQDIIQVLLEGLGSPMNVLLPMGQNYYNKDVAEYDYDVEKAKALLAEAGYPKGFEMDLFARTEYENTVAQVIQAQLSEIGITMKIVREESAVFLDQAKQGKVTSAVASWQPATRDADNPLRSLLYSSRAGTTNISWFQDAKFDKMIDDALALTDTNETQKKYFEVQQYIYDKCPIIPLFSPNWTCAANSHVQGVFVPNGGETLPYQLFYWQE